jgi:hypothetical protein
MDYTWNLVALRKTNNENFNDIVIWAEWKLTGIDAEGYSGSFSGGSEFKFNTIDPNNFIDFNNLTEEIVLNWIKPEVLSNGNYLEHIQARIQEEINQKKHPITSVGDNEFPWLTTNAP